MKKGILILLGVGAATLVIIKMRKKNAQNKKMTETKKDEKTEEK